MPAYFSKPFPTLALGFVSLVLIVTLIFRVLPLQVAEFQHTIVCAKGIICEGET